MTSSRLNLRLGTEFKDDVTLGVEVGFTNDGTSEGFDDVTSSLVNDVTSSFFDDVVCGFSDDVIESVLTTKDRKIAIKNGTIN